MVTALSHGRDDPLRRRKPTRGSRSPGRRRLRRIPSAEKGCERRECQCGAALAQLRQATTAAAVRRTRTTRVICIQRARVFTEAAAVASISLRFLLKPSRGHFSTPPRARGSRRLNAGGARLSDRVLRRAV
ncbi:hypothetical protein MTO96_018413 [Rhipicephalus appendiculatus]